MKYVSEFKELEDKKFDSVKELEAAEAEIAKKHAEKEKQVKERKEDAVKVEDAFKARNAARKEYNTTMVSLRKEFNKKLLEVRQTFEKKMAAEEEKLSAAEKDYSKALDDFTAKHPEGYHMTLRDGDNVTTIKRSSDMNNIGFTKKANSVIDDVIDMLFNF